MNQISELEDSESLKKNNPIIHYRFKRKFDYMNCHFQLYIADSKLKIIANCSEDYSKEIKTYSNSFSIYDFKKLNQYYQFFNKIEEILEDTARVFNQNNYDIERRKDKINIILHLDINEESIDIKLHLYQIKNNERDENIKYKKKKVLNNKPKKAEEYDLYQGTKNSNHNVGVKSMNELNNILTDLKDRLTVLEVTQNTSHNNPLDNAMNKNNNNLLNRNILNTGNYSYPGMMNENIFLNMESILRRINKLEEDNYKKTEKINLLKEKIKVYEPTITATSENDSINDYNNKFNFNNNYNNNNFNNNFNDYYNTNQNQKYLDLGSIKNNDNSTITSTNSYMKPGLLEIKEEVNNSLSKKKNNKKKKEKRNSSEDSSNYKKSDDLNTLDKNLKEKQKLKKSKNKSKNREHKNNFNIKKNNSKVKEKNGNKNIKEEIINTDIYDKNQNLRRSVPKSQNFDNQKMINKLENDLLQKNAIQRKNKSYINPKKNNNFEINDDENNINEGKNLFSKKRSKRNKDNNDDDINDQDKNLNINYYNKKNNNESSSNSNDKKSEKINIKVNKMIQINSSSHEESEENIKEKIIEKKKEEEIERELEEKEERKRRQKALQETSSGDNSLKVKQIHKSLTMVPKEDIRIYCKSHIIFTKDELRLLKRKINEDKNKYSVFFDVLYRASEDGDNVEIVKKIMQKEKKTLTLFHTQKGARFGIYVEKKLDTSILMNHYLAERPGTCFLVSLNNLEIYDIYKRFYSSENKLCFIKNKKKNRNGSSYAIYTPPKGFLGVSCYMGNINSFFNVNGNEDIIGEKEEYQLKEVEICKVSIEKRENNEDMNYFAFKKNKTEIPRINNKNKNLYGNEYSFQNKEDSSQGDNQGNIDENKNNEYNNIDEENATNKLKYDYYDWGIIKGTED